MLSDYEFKLLNTQAKSESEQNLHHQLVLVLATVLLLK